MTSNASASDMIRPSRDSSTRSAEATLPSPFRNRLHFNEQTQKIEWPKGLAARKRAAGAVAPPGGPGAWVSQHLSIREMERLDEASVAPSVGSFGDSCDNALAEFEASQHR